MLRGQEGALGKMPTKVIGGMIPYPPDYARELACRFIHVNMGDPEGYPEVAEAASRVVRFMSKAVTGRVYPGVVTSGATESNIIAAYLARESGYNRIVYFETAHYSISKAARLLGMKSARIRTVNGYEPDLNELSRVVSEGDLVVATIGNTYTGYIDPIPEIKEIAERAGAVIHVDAAFAGVISRFISPETTPTKLDNTLRTIAVDMHKIPEAPIGVGTLIAYREEYLEPAWFTAPYIPSGKQFGLLGTRLGGPLIAAAEIALRIESKLSDVASTLMNAARRVYLELVERGPYSSPHEPATPIICLTHHRIERVIANLSRKGYKVYTCRPLFNGIRLAILPHVLEYLDSLIDLLKNAAQEA